MNTSWYRKLLGSITLASTLFIFQACFGTQRILILMFCPKCKLNHLLQENPSMESKYWLTKQTNFSLPLKNDNSHFIPHFSKKIK